MAGGDGSGWTEIFGRRGEALRPIAAPSQPYDLGWGVSRGGCPGLPVRNSLYGLCVRRKATLKNRAQVLCERGGGRPPLIVCTVSVWA